MRAVGVKVVDMWAKTGVLLSAFLKYITLMQVTVK